MGGNGIKEDDWKVQDGPFSYKNGNWKIIHEVKGDEDGPDLKRNFKSIYPDLPDESDLKLLMNETIYDLPNYDSSSSLQGFRNRLEGWLRTEGDSRIKKGGTQLHNRVHVWINGHMIKMTSPNDPIFFLHHCFVDKIWWDWQEQMKKTTPQNYPHYYPIEDGPIGHNIKDAMEPFNTKISDLFDIYSLG
jgi:tyrosinase